MADAEQTFETIVDAHRKICAEVLLDFENYPDWSGPIVEAEILTRDEAGRGVRVAFGLDMKIRTIRYVLEYRYALPGAIEWSLVEGDISSVEGSYVLDALSEEQTRAICHQSIELGFWVPGPLRRIAERQALRESVLEFASEAVRRASTVQGNDEPRTE